MRFKSRYEEASKLNPVGGWNKSFALFPVRVGTDVDGKDIRVWLEHYQWRYIMEYTKEYRMEFRPIGNIPEGFVPRVNLQRYD